MSLIIGLGKGRGGSSPSPTPSGDSMLNTPLTFVAREDGVRIWFGSKCSAVSPTDADALTIEYSTDDGQTWQQTTSIVDYSNPQPFVTLNAGQKVMVRGDNASYGKKVIIDPSDPDYGWDIMYVNFFANYRSGKVGYFYKVDIYGNVMSLLDSTNFATLTSVPDFCFYGLFDGTSQYLNMSQETGKSLVLPATTLGKQCYANMFRQDGIVVAPALPATTLAESCYSGMFSSCKVAAAPELPATTLAEGCYSNMFSGCSYLIVLPELPAVTLAPNCYEYMFSRCYSLGSCDTPWGIGEIAATTLAPYCCFGMFSNSSIQYSPLLKSETLVEGCYAQMFAGCDSLTNIYCYATDISATDCTADWCQGVSQSGRFQCDPNTNWPSGDSGIPTGWTRGNL